MSVSISCLVHGRQDKIKYKKNYFNFNMYYYQTCMF